jgi:hypothetical protein
MPKKKEEVQEVQETQLPQQQVQLVDERPLPKALGVGHSYPKQQP